MKIKILLVLGIVVGLITSCELDEILPDHEDKETPCPVLSAESVPGRVKDSLELKYPDVTVEKWYNKDNKYYVAQTNLNSSVVYLFFDPNGTLVEEEKEVEQHDKEGNHEDENEDGCECNKD